MKIWIIRSFFYEWGRKMKGIYQLIIGLIFGLMALLNLVLMEVWEFQLVDRIDMCFVNISLLICGAFLGYVIGIYKKD